MLFADAVLHFRELLRSQGHSGPLIWISPADVVLCFGDLLIRPSAQSETHAERLFNQAVERGFGVALEAIAKLDHSVCCVVFAPENAEHAADHFVAPPLTMKVRQELKAARDPGWLLWWLAASLRTKRGRSRSLQFFGHDLDRSGGPASV